MTTDRRSAPHTDGAGFVDSLSASGVSLEGAGVVVLGAGAAARSIVDALGRAGVSDLVIVNRSHGPAEAAAALAAVARVGGLGEIAGAGVLVNATSVGMGSDQSPIDPALLHDRLVVADIVYHPLETALLGAARRSGRRTVDGLGMLVHQAVHQQRALDRRVPEPDDRCGAAAEAALAARTRT